MNIVVVGASRGIGLEFCKSYVENGDQVTAVCRRTNEQLNDLGCKVIDGFDVVQAPEKYREFLPQFPEKIDVLIYVAGILTNESLDQFDIQAIRRGMEVNCFGAMKTIDLLHDNINVGGKIAFITSRMGSIGDNTSGGMYGYRASKSALNSFGKSLAMDLSELKKPVLILHPGYVRTEMTGNNGLIDVNESVQGMVEKISTATMADSGRFWHVNGEELPW